MIDRASEMMIWLVIWAFIVGNIILIGAVFVIASQLLGHQP